MSNPQPGVKRPWLPVLTAIFALLLLGIVAIANSGSATRELLGIVRSIPGGDKTVHFVLAGTMALLLNLTWQARCWRIGPLPLLKGSAVIAVVATLEEYSQLWVRRRSFDYVDLAYDYLGILVLGQLAAVWVWWRARRETSTGGTP